MRNTTRFRSENLPGVYFCLLSHWSHCQARPDRGQLGNGTNALSDRSRQLDDLAAELVELLTVQRTAQTG